jgi:K+-sensing histidine kinase KdpD
MLNTTITIDAFLQDGETIAIKVSNEGNQISSDLRQRLFSFEVPSTVGTVGEKGTGIGLAMSFFFLKLNEGDLSLGHYTGPNDRTTCFCILLPAVTCERVEAVPKNRMEETMYV